MSSVVGLRRSFLVDKLSLRFTRSLSRWQTRFRRHGERCVRVENANGFTSCLSSLFYNFAFFFLTDSGEKKKKKKTTAKKKNETQFALAQSKEFLSNKDPTAESQRTPKALRTKQHCRSHHNLEADYSLQRSSPMTLIIIDHSRLGLSPTREPHHRSPIASSFDELMILFALCLQQPQGQHCERGACVRE